MRNVNCYRILCYIKQIIITHILEHKCLYLIALIGVLIGFATGIFASIKYASIIECANIPDQILVGFLKQDVGIFSLFFSRFITLIFLFLVIILISCVPFLLFLNFIILIYKSFVLALTIGMIIILYGISGVILTIFVLLPCGLIFLFVLTGLIVVCTERGFNCKKYGMAFFSSCQPDFPTKIIFFLFCLAILVLIVELLLLPIISVTFVIVV